MTWVGVGIIVVIAIAVIAIYNGFIAKRNRVQDALAQIDVQLKRRYDLIPNLIETVRGYAKYEKSVLTQVTALRASIVTGSVDQKLRANDQLSRALKSIFAVAESYPDLKASENFKELQEQLEGTEDKISYVRTSFNDYVLDYNNSLQTFPGNLFSKWFGFKPATFFQAPPGQSEPVKVDFSDLADPNSPPGPAGKGKKGS
ncbi:MAG: LemA family protein [Candidatus Micrarchaeota archaeon]|nr:LemA family protein [Candidatus Micrarchaeota archaeon]